MTELTVQSVAIGCFPFSLCYAVVDLFILKVSVLTISMNFLFASLFILVLQQEKSEKNVCEV